MDMTSSKPAVVYPPRSLTSTLKNRVFTECKDLLEKFACKVFVIVSEDGLSSQYIGSQDFVREFVTTGLKVKPCDVNVGLCPTAPFKSNGTHTIVEPSTDTYNRDNRNRDIFTKNEGVLLKQNSFTNITRETIDLQNDVNMADNYSQSGDSVMVEEDININRQQSNIDTQVAKWNDGIGNINGSDNDRKTCDPDTNQTYTEIGSCEETLQNQMELEGAEFLGKLKSQESCQHASPIAAFQNGGENESCSPDASTSNLESSYHGNRDTGNDETSDDDNSISDDTNQTNTLATSCNVSSVSGIEKPMHVRKKYERAKKPPMTDKELETHKERIRKAMIGDKSYYCEKCGKGYKTGEGLSLHLSLGICARQKCKYCRIDFLLKDWQNHMVDSHAEQIPVFPCRYCDRIFMSRSSRSGHKFLKHSNGAFECDVCKHVFSNRIALNNHKKTHIEKKFKCRYCDLRFTKQGIRRGHEKHSHSKVSAVCTECGETFDTRTHMLNHLKIVHSEHKFSCSYCDKKFCSKAYLKTHLESHGELSREYTCKVCKKVFHVRSEYRNHCMRDCTKSEYLCDICGRKFKRSTNLRLHALTHSEPTLKCDLCPRVFRLKSTLTSHVKSVHSDEKPWQCDVCGYRCKLRENLFKHTRIHSR